jgi:GNAT superfamily N-acetyltransferase
MIGNLRPATGEDSEFCFTLNQRSLGPVIVEVFGPWDDAVQREFHARWFDLRRLNIIADDEGTPIGVLDVQEETDHTYSSRIELLPEYQNRGVGGALTRDLLAIGRLSVCTSSRPTPAPENSTSGVGFASTPSTTAVLQWALTLVEQP